LNSSGLETQIGGGGETWTKYTVTYSQLAAASSVNSFDLVTVPAGTLVSKVIIYHTTAFTGGALSAYTLSVGYTNSPAEATAYSSEWNVFQAPATNLYFLTYADLIRDFANPTTIALFANTNGGGYLNLATQGSVDVYLLTSTLES
jgi:hypothetical protein